MTGDQPTADRIMETYWELFMEEQLSLEKFCERLQTGEFGDFDAQDIENFLREVEANIISNIYTMLEANPQLEPLRDERVEETHEMIEDLVAKYGTKKNGS